MSQEKRTRYRVRRRWWQRRAVRVWIPEEKGSDVNLATDLMLNAALDRFDSAIAVTNDADPREPIRLVVAEFGKRVLLFHPSDYPARKLTGIGATVAPLWPITILASQFPTTVSTPSGPVTKRAAGA